MISYTAFAVLAAFAYYLAGKFGRLLWERRNRPQGRRR
jgi:hypothetical protein